MPGNRVVMIIAVAITMATQINSVAAQQAVYTNSSDSFHLLEATVADVHQAFASGDISCRGLVELYLKRINAYDKTGPNLNTMQNMNPNVLETADQMDEAYQSSGPLGTVALASRLL